MMTYSDLKLSDQKLTLRPATVFDVDDIHEALVESRETHRRWFSWLYLNRSIADTQAWAENLEKSWEREESLSFVISENESGKFLGSIGLNRFDRDGASRANLGYWVRATAIGHGIAPAAAKLLARYAFEKRELQRLEIVIAVANEASRRVAQKLGAHHEGIARNRIFDNNKVVDAMMYSLIPEDINRW